MNVLAQSAFLSALGWALLHSLWQMGVLWLLYVVITANGQRFLARQRYNIALGLTAIGSLLFLLTTLVQFNYGTRVSLFAFLTYNNTQLSSNSGFFKLLTAALPLLSGIYLAVILFLFIRFFRQYYYTSRLINTGLTKAPVEIRLFLQQAATQLGVHKKIRIGFSDVISTPLTMGFWKPVILLPIAIASHLSIRQTEAIILHELNHIRKNDYLVNLLIVSLDIILFFNPFSRLLSAALLKERENSCDDIVLQFQYKPGDYARALLILEQYRLQAVPVLAVSATGSGKKHLLNRIYRILNGKAPQSLPGFRMLAFMFLALITGMVGFLNPLSIKNSFDFAKSEPAVNTRSSEITPAFSTSRPSKPAGKASLKLNNPSTPKPETGEDAETVPATITLVNLVKEENANEEQNTFEAELDSYEKNVVGYATAYTVNAQADRDYSINESGGIVAAPVEVTGFQAAVPYIPSSSFSYIYQLNTDTAFPKKYPVSESELKARMELEKAIATLENLDLGKLEKELGASAIQLKKLELQLKKTLQSDDWHKMSRDLQSNYRAVENQLRLKQAYLAEVGKINAQAHQQQALQSEKQQKILMDRIMENQQLQKCVEEKQKSELKKVSVKKTVVI